ncbi:ABC transporter substrate-binding protein [Castellaniella sp.]|uniref:ABC transporter substrate-binding protein n=1 Tax=Castellaniella sp. TaxID=1955812 RepID=UPI003562BAC3
MAAASTLKWGIGILALAMAGTSWADISQDEVRIGYLADLSGPYSDNTGIGGKTAIQLAIEDFNGTVAGKPIQLYVADHQAKADIGASIARQWLDEEKLDMIVGGDNSAVLLAVNGLLNDKKFVFMNVGGGSTAFTNDKCTPYTVQYHYNTRSVARTIVSAILKEGGKDWYFLTADYTFGHDLEKEAVDVLEKNGGHVTGRVRAPLGTSDFSSFVLQAQAANPQVLALANAGDDTINAINTSQEFGLTDQMKVAALLMYVTNVHAMGLANAQGLLLAEPWYWDTNDQTRAFAQRYYDVVGKMPNGNHAADYSATLTYLKAVEAAGSDDPDKVMAQLRTMQIDDMYSKGHIREDGTMVHDFYLFRVKTPEESKKPWDYMERLATVDGEVAFGGLDESTCSLVSH